MSDLIRVPEAELKKGEIAAWEDKHGYLSISCSKNQMSIYQGSEFIELGDDELKFLLEAVQIALGAAT